MEFLDFDFLHDITEILKHVDGRVDTILLILLFLFYGSISKWLKTLLIDKAKLFNHKVTVDTKVKEVLIELRSALGADRACTFMFSNTEESVNGFPYLYIEMDDESVDLTVAAKIQDLFKKQRVSNYPVTLGNLLPPDVRYMLYNVDDPNLPEEIRVMMSGFGVKSSLMFKFRKELMHGTISIHWMQDFYKDGWNEVNVNKLSDEDFDFISAKAELISKYKKKPDFWKYLRLPKFTLIDVNVKD
jgi:hypothetical protein